MIVYEYHYETGEYIGKQPAELDEYASSVLGKDVWTYPGDCTEVEPPVTNKGYVACYDQASKTWRIEEDHRGQTVYKKEDLSEFVIETIGPIPSYCLETLPEKDNEFQYWNGEAYVYPPLEELRAAVKASLDQKYEAKKQIPYTCGNYYVMAEWATIYTNTFVAMQQDENDDGVLDEIYKVLLITDPLQGKLTQIEVKSIDDFMPYYNRVKDIYKELTTDYHTKIVDITEATSAERLIEIIQNY